MHSPAQFPAWPRVALQCVIRGPLDLPLSVKATLTQHCEGDLWAEGRGVDLQGMGTELGSWALGWSCAQAQEPWGFWYQEAVHALLFWKVLHSTQS